MKKLFFVSTGRCGTMRISEILKKYLPEEDFSIQHQMDISRFANVAGNMMYYFGEWEWLKQKIYNHIIKKYANKKYFICSDPLISMILPRNVINQNSTYIIHIVREKESFANSFYKFTRKRLLSFIAHNFVPFWQIGVLPFENILNRKIIEKYKFIWNKKNYWIKNRYNFVKNYKKHNMTEFFTKNIFESVISKAFNINIHLKGKDLNKKANQS